MRQIATLISVQVGTPQHYPRRLSDGRERIWETSFFRAPVDGPRWLFTTHLDGNQQADTRNHGQLDQAVLLYGAAHYPVWREELGRAEIGPGGFGENFTVEGITEWEACIGDVYGLGEARVYVEGPRYPCWKIEERWHSPGLTARVAETGRTGWYCSVLREGMIEPGTRLDLIERPYPRWSIALINDFGHGRNRDTHLAEELFACPALHLWWQDLIRRQLR